MEPQKWMLSDTRLEQLQANDVYTICCHVSDCPCESKLATCPRGFFSLFIQAIYGIDLANRYGLAYYIDFGSYPYLYTDPSRQGHNVWNYFFEQTDSNNPSPIVTIRNSFNEVYPLRIWRRQHIFRLNNAVRQLVFKKEIEQKLLEKEEYFNAHQILGVQIRRTDHSQEIESVPLETFYKEIDKRLHKYHYLFVSTDDNTTLSLLKEQYGGKLIYNQVIRSDTQEAIHSNLGFSNRYKLGEEAILDCYCLSLCKHAILIQSNISYAALLFNPKLSYTLLEVTGVRNRLKRRIHSCLDRFHALLFR